MRSCTFRFRAGTLLGDKFYVVDEELEGDIDPDQSWIEVKGTAVIIHLWKEPKQMWQLPFAKNCRRKWLRAEFQGPDSDEEDSDIVDHERIEWPSPDSSGAEALGGLPGGISDGSIPSSGSNSDCDINFAISCYQLSGPRLQRDAADPCGHDECRSHAPCATLFNESIVWHPEACTICYDLVGQLVDGASGVREVALATLKAWVGGFGKNAAKGQPYMLDKKLAIQIFPAGKSTGYVDPLSAAPVIAAIQQDLQQSLGLVAAQEPVPDVAGLDLNLEPMAVVSEDLLAEVGLSGAQGLSLGAPGSSPVPSSSASFQGFSGSEIPSRTPALSVPPKEKGKREPKTLSKSTSRKSSSSSSARKSSTSYADAVKAKPSSSQSKSSRGKASKEKARATSESLPSPASAVPSPAMPAGVASTSSCVPSPVSPGMMEQVGAMVGSQISAWGTRFEQMFAQLSSTLSQTGQTVQELSNRVKRD
ncbi:uncharacterized protein LOC135213886 [Macrobrachium nipponense]|uniref:uncharacterized protein LOC135213886 n=1 Tax=Macrobrachium nipponense TaxID=159736 RepID=UPI0030C80106